MKVSAADAGGEATSAPAFGQHTYFSLPLIGLIHLDFAVQPVPVGANLLGRTGWGATYAISTMPPKPHLPGRVADSGYPALELAPPGNVAVCF